MSSPMPGTVLNRLAAINEETWQQIGTLSESMGHLDRAITAYECGLRHNPYSLPALKQLGVIHKTIEEYAKSADYFHRLLNVDNSNIEAWAGLGYDYLMMDDLQKAYSAYQQVLIHSPNPKDPKLWWGIGLLYDRNGSLQYAEEAFSFVLKIDPHFEKCSEVYFRLSLIHKKMRNYDLSLQCLKHILGSPPLPLTDLDIWFQIGHVYEQRKDWLNAKECYERVLKAAPTHSRVLQQLGWLYHHEASPFCDQEIALSYLFKSRDFDSKDAQTWYLIGRCRMVQQEYNKAYEAFHEAVVRDGKNPSFWCSIGVLYYQIKQYMDALNAYTRAIGINPYISEIWYDLGTLYEACKNQQTDAIEAYTRALEFDPNNPHIKRKINLLKSDDALNASENSLEVKSPTFYHGPQPPSLSRDDNRRRNENAIHGPPLTREMDSFLVHEHALAYPNAPERALSFPNMADRHPDYANRNAQYPHHNHEIAASQFPGMNNRPTPTPNSAKSSNAETAKLPVEKRNLGYSTRTRSDLPDHRFTTATPNQSQPQPSNYGRASSSPHQQKLPPNNETSDQSQFS